MNTISSCPIVTSPLWDLSLPLEKASADISKQALPEEDDLESLCKVLSLEHHEASSALLTIKTFLNIHDCLHFEKLKGGDCNAPILACKLIGETKIPFCVFKKERNSSRAEVRMQALDEMKKNGCDFLPHIFKDKDEKHLLSIGKESYSCIEYLNPDIDQSCTYEEMCALASKFHTVSKTNSFRDRLQECAVEKYSGSFISRIDPLLLKRYPSFFQTEDWRICVQCDRYFTSQPFKEMYRKLPCELIHGDLTPFNSIISQGKRYLIDLDVMKTDVRLIDFAIFSGWSFLERYLHLSEEDTLFPCIQTHYGDLEPIEKEYFHVLVLYGRCGALCWAIHELTEALRAQNSEKEKNFQRILSGTIHEICEIYHRAPKIKELIEV